MHKLYVYYVTMSPPDAHQTQGWVTILRSFFWEHRSPSTWSPFLMSGLCSLLRFHTSIKLSSYETIVSYILKFLERHITLPLENAPSERSSSEKSVIHVRGRLSSSTSRFTPGKPPSKLSSFCIKDVACSLSLQASLRSRQKMVRHLYCTSKNRSWHSSIAYLVSL